MEREILGRMRSRNASLILVTDEANTVSIKGVKGFITREQIADVVTEAADIF